MGNWPQKTGVKIAASILAADFAHLEDEIKRVEGGGCDLLHLDVMDGHFVPNLTIGPVVVKAIRRVTRLPLDVHLMIETPEKYIRSFTQAGADQLTVHVEACGSKLTDVIRQIRSEKVRCGVSIKPETPLSAIAPFLHEVDLVLVMSVNPGFGGQEFLPEALPKISKLRGTFKGNIEVDGGINPEKAYQAVQAGADILVAGTAIFGQPDVQKAIESLRCPPKP